ncbi:hypothetical protein [Streptomyces sp. WAC 01438]|nr:hypothetical protein [Streptomyces sp. WAC 01438]
MGAQGPVGTAPEAALPGSPSGASVSSERPAQKPSPVSSAATVTRTTAA